MAEDNNNMQPDVLSALVAEIRTPQITRHPKFGGDKAQWRSWKLETEGKLRVDKEALGDAEGHFMYIFMSLEGKAKDNVTTFVEMQTEKRTFNVAELLNRLELLEIANANAEYWPDDSKISYLQEALNDKMKAALIGSDPSAISSYVGLARRCDSLSSQMELLAVTKAEIAEDDASSHSDEDSD
ncbi:retrotransposon gag protein [Hirsutella rhossiliensis]